LLTLPLDVDAFDGDGDVNPTVDALDPLDGTSERSDATLYGQASAVPSTSTSNASTDRVDIKRQTINVNGGQPSTTSSAMAKS